MTDSIQDTGLFSFATYPTSEAAFERYEIPAEDIIEGNPYSEVAGHFQSPDGSLVAGVARIGVGKYKYRQTADEINYVTKGRMLITSDGDDRTIECVAGSMTRLDKGTVYTKTVLEPYEEAYVMFNDSAVQM
jgi:uncharacterized cupin superfamily protein